MQLPGCSLPAVAPPLASTHIRSFSCFPLSSSLSYLFHPFHRSSVSISSPFVLVNLKITPNRTVQAILNAAMDNISHPPLLKLPLEMMWEIANHLPDPRSTASLCRVNKQLHSMVEHQLYVRDAKSARPLSLQWAIARGLMETARKTIAAGAKVNEFLTPMPGEFPFYISDLGRNRTPLSYALLQGRPDMAIFLLQNGADPSFYRQNVNIPLHLASRRGDIDVMELCLEKSRKEINMIDRDSLTPLGHALLGEHEGATRLLIRQNDIVVNPPSSVVLNPVVWACRSMNVELLRLLLEKVNTIS